MVLLEKPPLLHFSTFDSIVGLQFHAHTLDLHSALSPDTCSRRIERFVAAAGTQIKIWAVSWPKTEESKNSPTALEIAHSDAAIEHNIVEPVTSEDIASKSNPGGCQVTCQVICVLRDHTPHYVITSRFSASGAMLASCDNRTILIFEFVRFIQESVLNGIAQEVWRNTRKITDVHSDIFDLCWHGNNKILTGSVGGIKIWDIQEQSLIDYVKYTDGFVTGVSSFKDHFVAAQSNSKHLAVWENKRKELVNAKSKDDSQHSSGFLSQYDQTISETSILALGISDLPYYRRPSFDATGRWVAFPYGERGNQCFGIVFSLTRPSLAPFRFRGHHLRVNCVAFSPTIFQSSVPNESKQPEDCPKNFRTDSQSQAERTGLFTLYAQASVDGALSFWKVHYAKVLQLKSDCILVLKPRFIDEQASVIDLAWTGDGTTLAVGADDGSITLVRFSFEEIKGVPYQGKTDSNDTSSLTSSLKLPPHLHLFHAPCSTIFAELKENFATVTGEINKQRKIQRDTECHVSSVKKVRRRVAPSLVASAPPRALNS